MFWLLSNSSADEQTRATPDRVARHITSSSAPKFHPGKFSFKKREMDGQKPRDLLVVCSCRWPSSSSGAHRSLPLRHLTGRFFSKDGQKTTADPSTIEPTLGTPNRNRNRKFRSRLSPRNEFHFVSKTTKRTKRPNLGGVSVVVRSLFTSTRRFI